MGPIGSMVIEVKGQINVFFSVGNVFFCLLPYFSQVLGPIFTELLDISSRDSFIKGQGHRGQRSYFFISAVLGPIYIKLGECIQVDPWLRLMGPIGSKVIEVKGQICLFFFLFVPPRFLGQSSPNLVGRLRMAQDISWRGSLFQRSRSSRSKVKFLYLGSPWSDLHETW